MTSAALDELARRHGIALMLDTFGGTHPVSDKTKLRILSGMGVDVGSDEIVKASLAEAGSLDPPAMRAPGGAACFLPDWLAESRAWGISLQLYELRSRRNWGIGDFADLGEICRIAARAGADFIGTNPLHALFLSDPDRRSPFSPSNRRFLNPLYIAVDRVPGYSAEVVDADEIERLRGLDLVDYPGVSSVKLRALRSLWQDWRSATASPPYSHEDFSRFRMQAGDSLERHALFEALSAWRRSLGESSGWSGWPAAYQDGASADVSAFASRNDSNIEFHTWLQWIAQRQLRETADAARDAGMRIGLYVDLAVGEAPDGSATWSDPNASVRGVSIGAPPDMFTADGQYWGLTPLSPSLLAQDSGRYRDLMDHAMRGAGALRIDHAMALWQLFFVPDGGRPADGAYVRYPIEPLLTELAEASRASRTIVIGEDLGNVPNGFRDVMRECSILSYRILYFERRDQGFIAPRDYPRAALACLSTHDMPTLQGWWAGDDIENRLGYGLIDAVAAVAQRDQRHWERQALMSDLAANGCLENARITDAEASGETMPADFLVAAHRFIARTGSMLAGVRLADLTGERKPTNLPGTIDEYPNWRPKSSVFLEDLAETLDFKTITRAVATERPRAP